MTNHMFSNMISHRSRVIKFIKKNRVVTSFEVAQFLNVSWNTADSWLKDLVIDGKIERIKKKGGLNLWMKK